MKDISEPIWKSILFWIVLIGSFLSILSGTISDGNCLVKILSILGGLITAIGGIQSALQAQPKVFWFCENDWQKIENGNALLSINASMHQKGKWPTYKTLTSDGEWFLCTQYIRENGDIELVVPQQSLAGLNGRVHVK